MAKELEAVELTNTWVVLPLPKGKHAIGCKWIYKVKYKSNGSIERYKACLVAKEYTQQEGLDFIDFFPCCKNGNCENSFTHCFLEKLTSCSTWCPQCLSPWGFFFNKCTCHCL